MLDIEVDCKGYNNVGPTACEDFISSEEKFGQFFNETKMLKEGEFCDITIDASDAVAHVYFVDTTEIGVLYNGYELGEGIEIERGNK